MKLADQDRIDLVDVGDMNETAHGQAGTKNDGVVGSHGDQNKAQKLKDRLLRGALF